jgi:hypothetical protein
VKDDNFCEKFCPCGPKCANRCGEAGLSVQTGAGGWPAWGQLTGRSHWLGECFGLEFTAYHLAKGVSME